MRMTEIKFRPLANSRLADTVSRSPLKCRLTLSQSKYNLKTDYLVNYKVLYIKLI